MQKKKRKKERKKKERKKNLYAAGKAVDPGKSLLDPIRASYRREFCRSEKVG